MIEDLNGFRADYRPITDDNAGWGRVAVLPWDEVIFGFPVADLELDPDTLRTSDPAALDHLLHGVCGRTGAALVSARAAGSDTAAMSTLTRAGFTLVDYSLCATLPKVEPSRLQKPRFTLRRAVSEDTEAILRIAGSAFHFGRYHTDPRFPRRLADARYVEWVRSALRGADPANAVFVLGPPDRVVGFMDVVIRENCADLRLGGVDPQNELGFAGFALYAETLRALHESGATRVSAKISAANTRVVNILSSLGFSFSDPEAVFHWHSWDHPPVTRTET